MLATTKNQLQDTNNDIVYDAAGNVTQPGPTGGPYVYDAENHLTSAGGVTYTYDGDGNRVMKSNGTIYWYGANSASLEETDLSGNLLRWYYFFNGQRVARQLPTNEVGFYMTDHLGNVRYLGGAATGYSIDYYPFGGIIVNSDTGDDRYQFTGKERDSESGLDNFEARYNSSSLGRFMSPDPVGRAAADASNPQSWNRYAYVRNTPLTLIDPHGECATWEYDAAGGTGCPGDSMPEGSNNCTTGGPCPWEPTNPAIAGVCTAQYESCIRRANGDIIGITGPGSGYLFYQMPFEDSRTGWSWYWAPLIWDPNVPNVAPGSAGPKPPSLTTSQKDQCKEEAARKAQEILGDSVDENLFLPVKRAGQAGLNGAIFGCLVVSEAGCVEGAVPGAITGGMGGLIEGSGESLYRNTAALLRAIKQYKKDIAACDATGN